MPTRQSDAGYDAPRNATTRAPRRRRARDGREDPGSVRARAGLPRVPGHSGRAARCHARDDRAAFRSAPRRRERNATLDPARLRAEGMDGGLTEAKVFATEAQPGYFLAIIPILPGCVASGKTRDEAIAKARRVFREYRALLEAHGVAIDHWKL